MKATNILRPIHIKQLTYLKKGGPVSYLNNLQIELVVLRVAFSVERQSLRLFPVDTKSFQIVVSQG